MLEDFFFLFFLNGENYVRRLWNQLSKLHVWTKHLDTQIHCLCRFLNIYLSGKWYKFLLSSIFYYEFIHSLLWSCCLGTDLIDSRVLNFIQIVLCQNLKLYVIYNYILTNYLCLVQLWPHQFIHMVWTLWCSIWSWCWSSW